MNGEYAMDNNNTNRREFLIKSIGYVGLGILAASIPLGMTSCSNSTNPSEPTPVEVDINSYSELQNVNGFKKISFSGKNSNMPVIVIRNSTVNFTAISSKCQHQGCQVGNPDMARNEIVCPCHGSKYRTDGSLVNGPSTKPLQSFPTSFNEATNILTITL